MRISVTDLDSFRYWKDSEMTIDELVQRLRGKFEPTPAMMAGRAFHSMLEHANLGEIDICDVDGYRFDFRQLKAEIAMPSVRELKAEYQIGDITLVGKVDALNGNVVHDYKLTEQFDAERYVDSYQWRCYLLMFGATQFVYDVFQARYDIASIVVYDYHRMSFSAYPEMRDDVLREVHGLAEIIQQYVPEKAAA